MSLSHARATQRALRELAKKHEAEFRELLERHKAAEGIRTLQPRQIRGAVER